ncbi:sulfatase [Spirochaetota bacterium]
MTGSVKKKEIPISKERSPIRTETGHIPRIVSDRNIRDICHYRAQYDGSIRYVDDALKRFLTGVESEKLLENTVVIITADHGEMLGEHNSYFRHVAIYEECLLVPLIVYSPAMFTNSETVSTMVSLVDIVPTVLNMAGGDLPYYIQGKSLLPLMHGEDVTHHKYVYAAARDWITVRSEEWKLMRKKSHYTLYNIKEDPKETRDQMYKRTDIYKEMKNVMRDHNNLSYRRQGDSIPVLDERQREILRSLGYME